MITKPGDMAGTLLKVLLSPKTIGLFRTGVCLRQVALTLFIPMKLFLKLLTIKSGWSIVYIEGSQVTIFKIYCTSVFEKTVLF